MLTWVGEVGIWILSADADGCFAGGLDSDAVVMESMTIVEGSEMMMVVGKAFFELSVAQRFLKYTND